MLLKIFNTLLTNLSKKITLKTVLTVPFLLQIFTTVGLVGYLSWRNGNQAVNDVASQLRSEVTDRVQQHLEDYLQQPHLIVELNQKATKLGQIGFKDFTFTEKYFWKYKYLMLCVQFTWEIRKENLSILSEKKSNLLLN